MIEIEGIFGVGDSLEKPVKSRFPALREADFDWPNGSQCLSFSEQKGDHYTLRSHVRWKKCQ